MNLLPLVKVEMTSFFTFFKIVIFITSFYLTNTVYNAKIMSVDLYGEVSERFKELVLKTSDSKEPRVRIPSSPPLLFYNLIGYIGCHHQPILRHTE